MILAGPVDAESNKELMGFGLFSHAVYDEVDGSFLSCVKYSHYWSDKTNDRGFKVGRTFGYFLAASTTLATLICILVQCFNKHGKTCLWTVMKWSYAFAFASQFLTFSIWASDICDNFDGESYQCTFGSNGVGAIANLLFLLGMAIATFNSQPPRNPVFRLWNIIPTEYETDKADTDEDQSDGTENKRHLKTILAESGSEDNDDRFESVSLFGGRSARGARSISQGSTGSGKSPAPTNDTSNSSKWSGVEDSVEYSSASKSKKNGSVKTSRTANTEATVASDDSWSFRKSKHSKNKSEKSGSIKTSRTANTEASTAKTPCTSNDSYRKLKHSKNESEKRTVFQGSSNKISKDPYHVHSLADEMTLADTLAPDEMTLADEMSVEVSHRDDGSKRSETSGSKKEANTTRSVRSRGDSTRGSLRHGQSIRSSRDEGSIGSKRLTLKKSEYSEGDVSFVTRLGASITLGSGGMRISESIIGNKLEIVDEYPLAMSVDGKIFPPPDADGTDIVKVRTEYCPEGSKTVKEVTHTDGSRTVTTVIDPTTPPIED
jgi:hypothetical protein